MTKRVTIKSIAKDLGISHMTVSRALSDHPNVQKETRAAIQKRADELGYVKSAAAKAMRGDGTKIIGLLLPNIVNEFYARFANTLAEACEEHSYHLIIHLTNDDAELERRSIQRLQEVQAMAVVMVPAPGDFADETKQLRSMKVIQLIRERAWDAQTMSILVDDSAAIRNAVIHVAAMGHKAIAYVGADAALSSGRTRLAAFRSGLDAAGLAEVEGLAYTGTPSYGMGVECAQKILGDQIATAIICGGVEISNGALAALLERNSDLDRDIGFVGYGDPSFYAWINGGVSTIGMPVEQLARGAIEMLDDSYSGATTESYLATLVVREGVT